MVGSGLEPQRFADTCGMRCRRAFNRSARKALASSARRCSRRRRNTPADTTAIITRRNINRIRCIPLTPTELRRCPSAIFPLLVRVPSRARSPASHKEKTGRGVTRQPLPIVNALCDSFAAVVLGVRRDDHRRGANHHDDHLKPDRHTLTCPRAHPATPIR